MIRICGDAEITLRSNCTLNKRKLKGSFLVQFSNCTLFIDNEMYSNINTETQITPFIPTTGLKVNTTTIINKIPIEHLQRLHEEQRDHIDHINLKTDNIHWKIRLFGWSSLGFGSLASITFIYVITLWIRKALTRRLSLHAHEDNRDQRKPEDTREPEDPRPRDEYPRIAMVPQTQSRI